MMRRSLLTTLFVPLAAPPPVNPADAVTFMSHLWNVSWW
jgi:hypothetical protein